MKAIFTMMVAILAGLIGFAGCQVLSKQAGNEGKEKNIYGLDDQTLESLGQKLGFKVEARGMSSYEFSRGQFVFFVLAHNDLSAEITRADEPVVLSRPVKGGPDVTAQIPIREGMPLSKVEQYFTDFISAAEAR